MGQPLSPKLSEGGGCILKYFLYLCNAGREQKPAKKQKCYKPLKLQSYEKVI